eukprot:scaffold97690_cov69-Phaeocystis_antarctica.AAC.4
MALLRSQSSCSRRLASAPLVGLAIAHLDTVEEAAAGAERLSERIVVGLEANDERTFGAFTRRCVLVFVLVVLVDVAVVKHASRELHVGVDLHERERGEELRVLLPRVEDQLSPELARLACAGECEAAIADVEDSAVALLAAPALLVLERLGVQRVDHVTDHIARERVHLESFDGWLAARAEPRWELDHAMGKM